MGSESEKGWGLFGEIMTWAHHLKLENLIAVSRGGGNGEGLRPGLEGPCLARELTPPSVT